jgi:hypothetical protein
MKLLGDPARRAILRGSQIVASVYACTLVLVGCGQQMLIYHPFHDTEPALVGKARRLRCEPWRDASGAVIGWKRAGRASPGANRLVVFHGNTGYALHRTHLIDGFEALGDDWEVYLFEYPGFGARPGKIGERPFIEAGGAALATLAATDARPIFLLGESLGSGLACALAGRHPASVRGLFLLTPFARLTEVGAHHFPWLPVRLLMRDRWDNIAALEAYRGPVAVLIASEDEVVTAAQGRALFESCAGPKRLWIETGASHNTIDFSRGAAWWRGVSAWLLAPAE